MTDSDKTEDGGDKHEELGERNMRVQSEGNVANSLIDQISNAIWNMYVLIETLSEHKSLFNSMDV